MSRKTVILTLALVVAASGAYAAWPRHADLRGFEPAEIARLETAMWRDYYEKRYVALFGHLYELSRTQFGFAPLDSVRIALSAAQAAKAFQPTGSRAAADAALPPLVTYYRLLASAAPGGFDVTEVARLRPEQYGVTVARVAAITYGKPMDDPSLLISGIGRADAMAYRDALGQAMTDPDWSEIECRLRRAYSSLKAAVAGGEP